MGLFFFLPFWVGRMTYSWVKEIPFSLENPPVEGSARTRSTESYVLSQLALVLMGSVQLVMQNLPPVMFALFSALLSSWSHMRTRLRPVKAATPSPRST